MVARQRTSRPLIAFTILACVCILALPVSACRGAEPQRTPQIVFITATPAPSPIPSASAIPSPTSLPSPTASGGGSGRLAFVSNRDGNSEIYAMNLDGTRQTRLTNDSAEDLYPAWSPDGTRIAFQSYRDGNSEIYVMQADGSNQTRLTNDPAEDAVPAWSPDSTRIAFQSKRDGNPEIYVMQADGSNLMRLTFDPAEDVFPSWSPDGLQIAFHSYRDGNGEIYVMNADGSAQTRLTNNAATDGTAVWSPSGDRIAFHSSRDGNYEIYLMNPDGTGLVRLTNSSAVDADPAWSPDGRYLAFQSNRDGNFELYVMSPEGLGQTRLTNNPSAETAGHWQPAPGDLPLQHITPRATLVPPPPTPTLEPALLNLAGAWQSNLGVVTFEPGTAGTDGRISVTGSWMQKDGKKGLIQTGAFNPSNRVLEFVYLQPWNNVQGQARLILTPDGQVLRGAWKQSDKEGEWNMQRQAMPSTKTPQPTLSPTAAPTANSTAVPPSPTATSTAVPPSSTHTAPTVRVATRTSTPSFPPGVYVTALRSDPAQPKRGQRIRFVATFVNTTGTAQQYNWLIRIYDAETNKGFGETAVQPLTVPPGTSQAGSADNWQVTGAGGCVSFYARAESQNSDKSRVAFTSTDRSLVSYSFQVCPAE